MRCVRASSGAWNTHQMKLWCVPIRTASIGPLTSRKWEPGSPYPDAVVLGVRAFQGKVPARSRFGNWATAMFFRLATGVKIKDTQTGLRAYGSHQLRSLMNVPRGSVRMGGSTPFWPLPMPNRRLSGAH